MDDVAQVQVRFTVAEDGYAPFTDALYVPLDEYAAMAADGRLETLKAERWANQKAVLDAPPAAPEDGPVESPVSSVDQARQILTDALAQLDALPPEE